MYIKIDGIDLILQNSDSVNTATIDNLSRAEVKDLFTFSARDVWKKRYFEEKKKTPPLEEQMNRMKQELDAVHRKLMSTLEGPKEKNVRFGDTKPSLKVTLHESLVRLHL